MTEKKYTAKFTEKTTETTTERTIEVPIVENYVDVKLPVKHRFDNGGFITVFQGALRNIAMFGHLTKNELSLLVYLIGSCGVDNSVCIDLNILSEDLDIKKPNVATALKGLVTRNIVIRKNGYRYGNNPLPMQLSLNYDQINYNLAYNGKTKNFRRHKVEHPQITEMDSVTLLEDHRQGQPVRTVTNDGRLPFAPIEPAQD